MVIGCVILPMVGFDYSIHINGVVLAEGGLPELSISSGRGDIQLIFDLFFIL